MCPVCPGDTVHGFSRKANDWLTAKQDLQRRSQVLRSRTSKDRVPELMPTAPRPPSTKRTPPKAAAPAHTYIPVSGFPSHSPSPIAPIRPATPPVPARLRPPPAAPPVPSSGPTGPAAPVPPKRATILRQMEIVWAVFLRLMKTSPASATILLLFTVFMGFVLLTLGLGILQAFWTAANRP